MRHQMPRCVIDREVLYPRDWHCCECGWPFEPCLEMYPSWRWGETTATAPRCGDDAKPYLNAVCD